MAETVGPLRPSGRVFMMSPDKKKKREKKNSNLIYQFIDARSGGQASTISGLRIVIPSVARNLLLLGTAKMSRRTGEMQSKTTMTAVALLSQQKSHVVIRSVQVPQ
jgi:hypothetical protein